MAGTADTQGVFIAIDVDGAAAADPAIAAKLAEVCPVDIFAADGEGGTLRIVEGNLDECVLCELCLEAAPDGAVTIRKLYDGTELRRDPSAS
ncbi:MAG: 4Fe-4S dicluster domain-containing protein [Solirubrobacterales bacterium]